MPSGGTNNNPIDFQFHYVLFNNDPAVHVYEVLNHSATDPATSVGQGQFLFRTASSSSLFPNFYQKNTGPNNLTGVTTTEFAQHECELLRPSLVKRAAPCRTATTDLTGSGIAGDNGTNFYTKYDYSTYTQFWQATTIRFGSIRRDGGGAVRRIDDGRTHEASVESNESGNREFGILVGPLWDRRRSGSARFPATPILLRKESIQRGCLGRLRFRLNRAAAKTGAQIYQDGSTRCRVIKRSYNSETELRPADI